MKRCLHITEWMFLLFVSVTAVGAHRYFWMGADDRITETVSDIRPPPGFSRIAAPDDTFAAWLRGLPLKHAGVPVRLFDGTLKKNQSAHFRVIDIDVGSRNLQQCADAVIRLRAEFLYQAGRYSDIAFNFTSGDRIPFLKWALGDRPVVSGDHVTWKKRALPESDFSYKNFRRYLDTIFTYAGSYSLSREMIAVPDIRNVQIGDVFIRGGFPGHAVIVVDLAVDTDTGRKALLLAQSYMPAQELHVLKNPENPAMDPWFIAGDGQRLVTPEWIFKWSDLKRFQDTH